MCPYPYMVCCRLPIPGIEPQTSQSQMDYSATRVRAISDKWLLRDGIEIWVRYFPKKNRNPIFSVLRHASKPPPTGPKNRCCGMLRQHAVACFNRWCLSAASPLSLIKCLLAHHPGAAVRCLWAALGCPRLPSVVVVWVCAFRLCWCPCRCGVGVVVGVAAVVAGA